MPISAPARAALVRCTAPEPHNDLAKEQNWLRAPEGRAYVLDSSWPACSDGAAGCFALRL